MASKKRMLWVAFATCLVLVGLESVSASAASLFVGGVKLSTGSKAAVSSKAVVDEPAIFTAPSISLRISCTQSNAIASTLVGENKGEAEARIFEGCSEMTPKQCKVEEARIETEPVITTFILGTKSIEDRFILGAKTGHLFAGIRIAGPLCSIAGELAVGGEVKAAMPTGQSESVSQTVEGLGSAEGNDSLEVAGAKFFVEKGKGLIKLVSGSKWSFR